MEHASELRYVAGSPDQTKLAQAAAGRNMVAALGVAHGWLLDQTKLLRLMELSVGPEQKSQVSEFKRQWELKPWAISFSPTNPPSIRIMQYEESSIESAKIKLSQFARGTRFQWRRSSRQFDAEDRAIEELSTFAASVGIVIDIFPPK